MTHFEDDVWYRQNGDKIALMFNYRQPHDEEIGLTTVNKMRDKLGFTEIEAAVIIYEASLLTEHAECNQTKVGQYDRNELFGTPKNEFTVFSLRDVRNCFASFIKQYGHIPSHIIPHWEDRAKEWLGKTNLIGEKQLLNYNMWASDVNYRHNFCLLTGLKYTDLGINLVPKFADGSSFDKTTMDGRAQDMDVNNRWRQIQDTQQYKHAMRNMDNLEKLSEEIFGAYDED